MSRVTCHTSHVTCHMLCFTCQPEYKSILVFATELDPAREVETLLLESLSVSAVALHLIGQLYGQ